MHNPQNIDRIWELFLEEVHKDAGLKPTHEVKNFLGSTAHHKKLFERAIHRFDAEFYGSNDPGVETTLSDPPATS